ncbi:DUF4243 domain-containing protein [Modestobacter sp. I12A-02628]|uniref:Questin oxidase family protein n=2 Tax=Goekera deserti TaxID=2497753 RepID=A0A7K3WFF9_9ACTN|nr:DUF4243 domain-containing protein [Goekera deserti]NDI49863.1 DUF4243 domain-containing protein [Goekera deserti]NEL55225.1 questin oxidase family protein [Goekera deserti]
MAADALLRIDPSADVHRWVDGYVGRLEQAPGERWPVTGDDWHEALGDAGRLGDWLAFFDRELAGAPWPDVLARWWPRLVPGSIASATHCLIRTGHAVRALREVETAPRRAELAAALGYWAARWQPMPGSAPLSGAVPPVGIVPRSAIAPPVGAVPPVGGRPPGEALDGVPVLGAAGDLRARLDRLGLHPGWRPALRAAADVPVAEVPAALTRLVDAAVVRYGRWAPGSPVMLVHAATAPRAAALVLPALPPELWPLTHQAAWTAAAAIAALYRPAAALPDPARGGSAEEVVAAAVRSGDEHALKFAEVALESASRGVPTAAGAALRAAALIN